MRGCIISQFDAGDVEITACFVEKEPVGAAEFEQLAVRTKPADELDGARELATKHGLGAAVVRVPVGMATRKVIGRVVGARIEIRILRAPQTARRALQDVGSVLLKAQKLARRARACRAASRWLRNTSWFHWRGMRVQGGPSICDQFAAMPSVAAGESSVQRPLTRRGGGLVGKIGTRLTGSNKEIRLKGHFQVKQTTLPLQRMLDDRIEIIELRLPVQHAANAIGGGNGDHDVALAPFSEVHRKIMAGNPPDGINHLADRIASAVSAVERDARAVVPKIIKSGGM